MEECYHVRQMLQVFEAYSLQTLWIHFAIVAKASVILGGVLFSDDDAYFVRLARYDLLAVVEEEGTTQGLVLTY